MHRKGEIKTKQILRALYLTQVHLKEEGHLLGGHTFT